MRNRHQDARKTSVMLGHASQTSWLMQNVRHKSQNLPDADTFTLDIRHFVADEGDHVRGAENIHSKFSVHVQM